MPCCSVFWMTQVILVVLLILQHAGEWQSLWQNRSIFAYFQKARGWELRRCPLEIMKANPLPLSSLYKGTLFIYSGVNIFGMEGSTSTCATRIAGSYPWCLRLKNQVQEGVLELAATFLPRPNKSSSLPMFFLYSSHHYTPLACGGRLWTSFQCSCSTSLHCWNVFHYC